MKRVVWFLLLLNAGLLAYFSLRGTPAPQQLVSRQPVQPEKIRLLTQEQIDALPGKTTTPEPPPQQATVPAPVQTACYEWGSFDRARLGNAQNVIQSFALHATVKGQSRQEALRYWVYIPPIRPLEKAQERMEEIRALGIEESFLVQEPKWKNAISFGIFKDEQFADRLLDELKAQGVTGVVKGVRNQEKGRVSLLVSNMSLETAAEIEKLKPDFPGSELKQVTCQ